MPDPEELTPITRFQTGLEALIVTARDELGLAPYEVAGCLTFALNAVNNGLHLGPPQAQPRILPVQKLPPR